MRLSVPTDCEACMLRPMHIIAYCAHVVFGPCVCWQEEVTTERSHGGGDDGFFERGRGLSPWASPWRGAEGPQMHRSAPSQDGLDPFSNGRLTTFDNMIFQ